MDRPVSVLFICSQNSARSQMAEAYLNTLGAGRYQAESAGLAPTEINPLVVRAMAEEGIDLTDKGTQSVFDLFKAGRVFDYVITVCDEAAEACPVFPGLTHRLHLPFADPARLTGSDEEKLAEIREIRAAIKAMILELIAWDESGRQGRLGDAWSLAPQA
jgi:arsenate reductase